jgi:hypothetical protein
MYTNTVVLVSTNRAGMLGGARRHQPRPLSARRLAIAFFSASLLFFDFTLQCQASVGYEFLLSISQ